MTHRLLRLRHASHGRSGRPLTDAASEFREPVGEVDARVASGDCGDVTFSIACQDFVVWLIFLLDSGVLQSYYTWDLLEFAHKH
jgi:hypothetical protein